MRLKSMRLKLVIAISTSAGILLALIAAVFLVSGDKTASAQAPGGSYMWSYSTKFICGTELPNPLSAPGEPPVKPGNYATDINIHNPNYQNDVLFKKMVIIVGETSDRVPFAQREPETAAPGKFVTVDLRPDYATMDDCRALTALANQTGATGAGGFMVGYLVVLSRLDIDIDAVYTAEVYSGAGATNVAIPAGIAEDVLHVAGKRVFVPGNVLPGGNPGSNTADGN